jgi:RNA polymerase sigma factor (sigma-70 family)
MAERQAHTATRIPETDAAYLKFRRLLFGALANLARQGFKVSPVEGLDLIQDFFADAWSGISSRYDPSRGKFETYVYKAFIHFARPRIMRLHRWQSYLVNTIELVRTAEERSPVTESEESWYDINIVRDALLQLPSFEREVLYSYLLTDIRSERKLAERFSVSRYRLRETLVTALGRVMVLLGEPGRIPEDDWKVALVLWQEGRTVPEAAGYLGRTVQEVREARSRIAKLLAEGLKHCQPTTHIQQRGRPMDADIYNLLKGAIASPGDQELLKQIRAQANAILTYLERSEFSEELEQLTFESDPEWVAEVYGAIAGEEELSPEDRATLAELFKANTEQEILISSAFAEVLMSDLPRDLHDIRNWFQALPPISEDERKDLYDHPAVQASRPYSDQLIVCGMTPLTIFYSTEAISTVVDRLMRYEVIPQPWAVIIGLEDNPRNQPTIVLHEIANVAECSQDTAQLLLPWLVRVAQFKPYLFGGFEARPISMGIHLVRTSEVDSNLYKRWAVRSDPSEERVRLNQKNIRLKFDGIWDLINNGQLQIRGAEYTGQKYTDNPEAWELWRRGAELYRKYTKEANAQARELFEKAISLDPQFARAYANLAATYRQDWDYEWTADLPAAELQAFELAQRSVAIDPSLPYGHVQLAYLYVYRRQHDDAIREAEEAIKLGGANYADGYTALAQVLTYAGELQRAITLIEEAMSLDLRVPVCYLCHLGHAYYVIGQVEKYQKGDAQKAMEYYQKAEEYLKRAMEMNRNHRASRLHLVAVYMESGRELEARALFAEFPDMRRHITISQRRQQAPYKDPAMRDRYIDALRRAGSSEGTP